MARANKNLLTVFESTVKEMPLLPSRTLFCRHSLRWMFVAVLVTVIFGAPCLGADEALKGIVGSSIEIPCVTVTEDCGIIHSVRWYHNDARVYAYLYTQSTGAGAPEGSFMPDRAQFKANVSSLPLYITSIKLSDEGTYRCDVTYISLASTCPTTKSTELHTIANPNSPEIYLELPDDALPDGPEPPITKTTIGPFYEETMIVLKCESTGGKPAPQVSWWLGKQALAGDYSKRSESDGTEVAVSEYRLKASRSILLDRYDCQVTHETLGHNALTSWVEIDVFVPPVNLELTDMPAAKEGEEISLTCLTSGARPAAKITWYNGSEPLMEQPSVTQEKQADHTYHTTSIFAFTASRFDDEETIKCESSNEASEKRGIPLADQTQLTVYYAPVVRLSALDDTGATIDQLELNEGATLRLECAFEANPVTNSSVVRWFQNGHMFRMDESGYEDDADGANKGNDNDDSSSSKQQENDSGDKDGRFLLVLAEINRRRSGEYSCSVTNNVGMGQAENSVNVSILYPPEVRLIVDPVLAVEHVTNVTLTCVVEDANPFTVQRIRWFRDSQLINETVEVTKVLEEVDRKDHRNYSCQAENKVGWGSVAEPVLLDVIYTPGKAKITHRPPLIVKGQPVMLMCELDDPGNPPATEFTWYVGDMLVDNIKTSNWSLPSAELGTVNEYICKALNAAGEGVEGKAKIVVYAAPFFITSLSPSTGALETAKDISLSCQVECDPRCNIDWYKNGELLTVDRSRNGAALTEDTEEDEENGDGVHRVVNNDGEEESLQSPYSVKVSYLAPNFRTLHFSSVVSTLKWNISSWPNKRLDRILDVANYTCRSSPNLAGIDVNSTTLFHVEYPPENISLSHHEMTIEELQVIPFPIICKADGNPELTYTWTFEDKAVSASNELKLDFSATREKSGVFTCIASNLHGNITSTFSLDVQYKPDTDLHSSLEEDGSTLLTCTVEANPEEVNFIWLLNNETIKENIHTRGLVSRLKHVRIGGKYCCMVNNSVGQTIECIDDLHGTEGAMIAGFTDNRIIIIIVIVAAIIIVSVIVCIVIFLIMKRRGSMGKYCNPMELDQRESPEGLSQIDSTKPCKPGRKPGVVTFKRVEPPDSGVVVGNYAVSDEFQVSKSPRNPAVPPGEGNKAFYENLPFHGLQPAPNKETLERPVPAPRDYSPTKMRHIYQNLLLPLRAKPFKPLIPDLEYADVDFSSANQGQPPSQPEPVLPPPTKEAQQMGNDATPDVVEHPERPPRVNKTSVNNNHA